MGVADSVSVILEQAGPKDPVFIDIPIGLRESEGLARGCDSGARSVLGKRASSVFSAPLRPVLAAADYPEANALSRQLSGKGLSKQAYNIMPKIREVDTLLLGSARARAALREVHPEVCFWSLAGRQAMSHNKKTQSGFDERLAVLTGYLPEARDLITRALLQFPRKLVARDDIVDAFVVALTASRQDSWRTLPPEPERDMHGLPMEIVYAI